LSPGTLRSRSVRSRQLAYARVCAAREAIRLRLTADALSFQGKRRLRRRLPRRLFRRLRHKKAVVRFLRKHGARIRRFRLARLPALRIDSELISNKTAELKGLISRRNRNSRRRVVVKTFGRWW
jgi:hypothetical protein